MKQRPLKILFVCLGNICRSPVAEGVARHWANRSGLPIEVDSAGLGDWHVGQPPHATMRQVAAERGIPIDSLRARQVSPSDLQSFDWIVGMDRANLKGLLDLQKKHGGSAQIRMLCESEVPDPYYGGLQGFYDSFDQIHQGVQEFFIELGLRPHP